MRRLLRLCRRLIRRPQPIGSEIYDAALDLARRQGRFGDCSPDTVLPGEWV